RSVDVTHDHLVLVLRMLESDRYRVLIALDGFDAVLTTASLTRNLWDNLRDLAQWPSLCLVTGSRRPLRARCVTEPSQTSDFWEIFDSNPLGVGAFDHADWDELLAPLRDEAGTIAASGRKEIENWTGGVPVLTAGLLGCLFDRTGPEQTIDKEVVDAAAMR